MEKKPGYVYTLEAFKNGKLLWVTKAHNLITDQGIPAFLDRMLHGTTQIATWYLVISETNTAPAAGMTYAVPVFTETTAYDESTRPEYNEAAASNKTTTNSANPGIFTFNATKTLYGAGLVGGGSGPSTKNDKAGGGILLSYALFSAPRVVDVGTVVRMSCNIGGADDGV